MSRSLGISAASVCSLIGAVLLAVLLLVPSQKRMQALADHLEMLNNTFKERQALLEKAKTEQAQIPTEAKAQFALFIPSGSDVSNLVAGIDALAARQSVIIDSMSPAEKDKVAGQPSEAAGYTKQFSMRIATQGSYGALRSFVEALERNIRLTDVRAMTLEIKENATAMAMNLDIVAYYQDVIMAQ